MEVSQRSMDIVHTHRLRMSVSYSQAGMNVSADVWPVSSHTSVFTPAARTLEQAGARALHGRCQGRRAQWREKQTKRSASSRENRAANRGEHLDFHSFNDTILDLLHTFIERWFNGWGKRWIRRRRLTVPLVRCKTYQIWSGISTGRPTPR